MVVGCHRLNSLPKNALLWGRACTRMLHGSCFSLCVCLVLFVFQRIKSHTELLTLSRWLLCLTTTPLAGACQQSFRAQTRPLLSGECRSSRPTFRSLAATLWVSSFPMEKRGFYESLLSSQGTSRSRLSLQENQLPKWPNKPAKTSK